MDDMKDKVTGTLFVRNTGAEAHAKLGSGRRLVMVCGVFAIPEGADFPDEHQFVVNGELSGPDLNLRVFSAERRDLSKLREIRGCGSKGLEIGDLLTEKIWRV